MEPITTKRMGVVSLEDMKAYMKNAASMPSALSRDHDNRDAVEFEERRINAGTTAAMLLSEGSERYAARYKRSSRERRDFLESQRDLFAQGLVGAENLAGSYYNPFGPFESIEIKNSERGNGVDITFHDPSSAFGAHQAVVTLPIVDHEEKNIMVTVDDIWVDGKISDSRFDDLVREISGVMEKAVDSIRAEGKPTWSVVVMSEDEFVEMLEDIRDHYGENSFRFTPSVYKESKQVEGADYHTEMVRRSDNMLFRFNDKTMRDMNDRYSDQHDCESPNHSVGRNAVEFPACDVRYNNANNYVPTIVIREPWMVKNAFSAAMHANLLEYVSGNREISMLHEAVDRPEIKRPYRPSMDKRESMSFSM